MPRFVKLLALALLPLSLAACSVGIGYHIPGTPVSVGTSVPLSRGGSSRVRYLNVDITSRPEGAEIFVNGQLVGSTPSTVSVPFERRWFGRARGSAQVLLKKTDYLPEGLRVFAVGKKVSLSDGGAPVERIEFTLEPGC